MTIPCPFSGSRSMSFRSVFHFREFDETISGTGNDFGVVCMWHELCRENVSHVAFLIRDNLQSRLMDTRVEYFSDSKLVVGRPDEQSMVITSRDEILAFLTPSIPQSVHSSQLETHTIVYLHILCVHLIHMTSLVSRSTLSSRTMMSLYPSAHSR
jgi:hypothetical protein